MSDGWNARRKGLEDDYFHKQNQEALNRISSRPEARLSPITGEPMEQITIMGVVVDKCKTSGGIWLDAGELEQIIEAGKGKGTEDGSGMLASFLRTISGKD
jgi:hypothetical protein